MEELLLPDVIHIYIILSFRDFLIGHSLKEFPHKLSLNYLIFKELRSLQNEPC